VIDIDAKEDHGVRSFATRSGREIRNGKTRREKRLKKNLVLKGLLEPHGPEGGLLGSEFEQQTTRNTKDLDACAPCAPKCIRRSCHRW
jgi:hypothetical protein